MAEVVRAAFDRLADRTYTPVYPAPGETAMEAPRISRVHYAVRVLDLLDAGLLAPNAVLVNPTDDAEARVLSDGRIEFDGTAYDSPSGASDAAHGATTNGWTYWLADTTKGLLSLAALRDEVLADSD